MSATRILVVCTANVCRSPMAEALLQRRLDERGIDAHVESAGVRATGQPVHPSVLKTLSAGWGLEINGQTARPLTDDMVNAADLIIAMAREHVREIVTTVPDVWPRAFTLRELVRRGSELGVRPPDTPLSEWLAQLSRDRRATELVGVAPHDDIADPIGHDEYVFRKTADDLDDLIRKFVALSWP